MPPKSRKSQTRITDAFNVHRGKVVRDIKKNVRDEKKEMAIHEAPNDNEDIKAPAKTAIKEKLASSKPFDVNSKELRAALKKLSAQEISSPIHQENLSIAEKILKKFDLDMTYGPTVGMTRLDRWKRAEKLHLSPPIIVKQILESPVGLDDPEYREGYLFSYV